MLALAFFSVGMGACTARRPEVEFGLAADKVGYVPARIAVMSCRVWPVAARYKKLAPAPTDQGAAAAICGEFDKFILASFRDQPYMKGFTPSAVGKLLASSADNAQMIDQFDSLWHYQSGDCHDCDRSSSFYYHSIRPRSEWVTWLNQFSRATRNSDAILLPFILYADQTKANDRGMLKSVVSAAVGMLLVDTNNGAIIWSNERQSEFAASALTDRSGTNYPAFPQWSDLTQRLLSESLWQEFPGRLIL